MNSTSIDHVHINISNLKISGLFYDKLLKYFGFKILRKEKYCWTWHNNGRNTFTIEQTIGKFSKNKFYRKQIGLNHIAFKAATKNKVDKFYKFLLRNKISILYNGPKSYPKYWQNYYAVFFEDPDRIKLEFMWLSKK